MKCPVCGTTNAPGESFCSNCGAYLDPNAGNQTMVSNAGIPAPATGNSTISSTLTGSGGRGTSSTLSPNSRLQNGRYVIEKILGQGGMGAALLARDSRVSNKRVVIKELISDNTDPTKRQEDVRNFEREVETLAAIDHPLVPNVTDSFQEGTRYFMVQEYVEGENLENRMERVQQPMPEREALAYTSQMLDVLDYLGQQSPPIVHRDIKPANIIIGAKDKRAHLVDFGIARADVARNSKRKQTSALGTPGYAPPEQYQGNADMRSDLYALAATLHHILTNRDPRNYPPFTYPAARTLNPQLSPEIEQVLSRALQIDITKRYQSAAAMKQEIDGILQRRFGTSGDMSGTYTFGTSGPMATIPATPAPMSRPSVPTPIPASNVRNVYPPATPPPPIPLRPAQQQVGTYANQPRQRRRGGINWVGGSFALLLLVVIIIALLLFLPGILRSRSTTTGSGNSTGVSTATLPKNGIGVTMINGEPIGISDGTLALDIGLPDGTLKQQAATALVQGNTGSASALWSQAVQNTTNDAEALIYLENQHIAAYPHITIVVATMLSGNSTLLGVGRDDLQGAYVAQKEFNDGSKLSGGLKVRLLIANAGSSSTNATQVAQQIVQLAKADKTVVGVMGFPYSGYTINALQVLSQAHIPIVSQTASSDQLSGMSPYFFRVAPSNKEQGIAGANYALQVLKAKSVAVFYDQADSYSQSLGIDFQDQFTKGGGTLAGGKAYAYTEGNTASITSALQSALSSNPNLIYFSGYSNDMATLLGNLSSANAPSNLQILGGDALYELGGYPSSVRSELPRLHFTTFFYPDMWSVLGLASSSKQPPFLSEYPAAFNPNNVTHASPYGYTRAPNDAALSYDGTLALLQAAINASKTGQTTLTPTAIQQGLTQINASNPLQGISGQIAFDNNGDPTNKAVVILFFNPQGYIQMDSKIEGTFLTP